MSGIELVSCIRTQCESSVVTSFERGPATPGNVTIRWQNKLKNVLLVSKPNDPEVAEAFDDVAKWLCHEKKVQVWVVEDAKHPKCTFLKSFTPEVGQMEELIDLIVCLGGDGTLLHITHRFNKAVPPIIAINMGSLGFLATYKIADFKQDLGKILDNGDVYVTIRNRLEVRIHQPVFSKDVAGGYNDSTAADKVYQVLNEVVIDRGTSPFLTELECYCNDDHITTIQADGIIISTATGSTAYSMAAGGSMVHPNVPCILLTPICAHTLSFRPVILPDSCVIRIEVPHDARGTAWLSCDGRDRTELKLGHYVEIMSSRWPAPTLCRTEATAEWFSCLAQKLNWSKRSVRQKYLGSVSQEPIYQEAKGMANTMEEEVEGEEGEIRVKRTQRKEEEAEAEEEEEEEEDAAAEAAASLVRRIGSAMSRSSPALMAALHHFEEEQQQQQEQQQQEQQQQQQQQHEKKHAKQQQQQLKGKESASSSSKQSEQQQTSQS